MTKSDQVRKVKSWRLKVLFSVWVMFVVICGMAGLAFESGLSLNSVPLTKTSNVTAHKIVSALHVPRRGALMALGAGGLLFVSVGILIWRLLSDDTTASVTQAKKENETFGEILNEAMTETPVATEVTTSLAAETVLEVTVDRDVVVAAPLKKPETKKKKTKRAPEPSPVANDAVINAVHRTEVEKKMNPKADGSSFIDTVANLLTGQKKIIDANASQATSSERTLLMIDIEKQMRAKKREVAAIQSEMDGVMFLWQQCADELGDLKARYDQEVREKLQMKEDLRQKTREVVRLEERQEGLLSLLLDQNPKGVERYSRRALESSRAEVLSRLAQRKDDDDEFYLI